MAATVFSSGTCRRRGRVFLCLSFALFGLCLPRLSTANVTPADATDAPLGLVDASTTEKSMLDEAFTTAQPRPRMQIARINYPRVETPLMIALWVFVAILSKIGYQAVPRLPSLIPESCVLIVIGVGFGLGLFYAGVGVLSPLSSTVFFFCMLPPIIFDAGYFMPNRLFFDHLGTILLFAVVGTMFNTFAIGLSLWACGLTGVYGFEIPPLEIFIFSALISAVDPVAVLSVFDEIHVDEVLYIIVFGESLLNDAVTVVLYNMFDSYVTLGPENIEYQDVLVGFVSFTVVAVGGATIGIVWGFLTGFTTRFTHTVRVVEPVYIFAMSYLAYVNAETFQMSGILSIMFCGITMKNYVQANVSAESYTTIVKAVKMLSNTSETIIFIFLGIDTVHDHHAWNTAFIGLTILFCTIYRVLGIILLTEIANRFRLHQLETVEKFVMSYGGLRGAIAFALVLSINPARIAYQPLFVTATISVVFFTVFFQGITIKPLVRFLQVRRAMAREKTINERIHEKMMDYAMAGIEDTIGRIGTFKVRERFKHINKHYINPLLIREDRGHEPKILDTYNNLLMTDAIEIARKLGSSHHSADPSPTSEPHIDESSRNVRYRPRFSSSGGSIGDADDVLCGVVWKPVNGQSIASNDRCSRVELTFHTQSDIEMGAGKTFD